MKVLIRSGQTREVSSKKTGRAYFIQSAALDNGDDFPHPFEILHDDRAKAYPVGEYTFAVDAIYVSRDGRLSVSPRLVPVQKSAAKSA